MGSIIVYIIFFNVFFIWRESENRGGAANVWVPEPAIPDADTSPKLFSYMNQEMYTLSPAASPHLFFFFRKPVFTGVLLLPSVTELTHPMKDCLLTLSGHTAQHSLISPLRAVSLLNSNMTEMSQQCFLFQC